MKILLCLLGLTVSISRAQTLNPYYPSPLLGPDSPWRLGGATFQPEDSVTAAGLKQQLIRRYHYLEYIKTMYKELKKEYTRFVSCLNKMVKSLMLSGIITTTLHC